MYLLSQEGDDGSQQGQVGQNGAGENHDSALFLTGLKKGR